ncbi:MAG: hypothetical protein ABFC94_07225 [Syntrophomonas sp.]
MSIIVTKHAIRRYRERLFSYSLNDNLITNKLKEIASKGTMVATRPNDQNTCCEIKYKGVSIVVVCEHNNRIVLTCLGEDSYRRWVKSKGLPGKLSQRLLIKNTGLAYQLD